MSVTHTFYLAHDNDQAVQLLEAGVNLTLTQYDAITRVTIELRTSGTAIIATLDSDVTMGLMAWGTGTGQEVRIEGSKLGDAGATTGYHDARLTAYSADQPTGIVWLDYWDYRVIVNA